MYLKLSHHSRKNAIPFRDGRPFTKYLRAFQKRHSNALRFVVPTKQEGKRFAAVNGNTLASQFSTLQALIEEYNIDRSMIWNLDETGSTPGRAVRGNSRPRRYLRRNSGYDIKLPESFGRDSTLMPVVNTEGDCGPPLLIFTGSSLPYRQVVVCDKPVIETFSDYLPRGACIATRAENGGVYSVNFINWTKMFVESVKDLTANRRNL